MGNCVCRTCVIQFISEIFPRRRSSTDHFRQSHACTRARTHAITVGPTKALTIVQRQHVTRYHRSLAQRAVGRKSMAAREDARRFVAIDIVYRAPQRAKRAEDVRVHRVKLVRSAGRDLQGMHARRFTHIHTHTHTRREPEQMRLVVTVRFGLSGLV